MRYSFFKFLLPLALTALAFAADTTSFLWLDRFPQDSRDVAVWAEHLRQSGYPEDAARLYRILLMSDDSSPREWAALWLGIVDTSLKWADAKDSARWGLFFHALRVYDSAPDSAERIFVRLTESAGEDILRLLAYYWAGISAVAVSDSDSAFALWSEANKKFPHNLLSGEISYRLGAVRFGEGRYAEAESLFVMAAEFYDSSLVKSRQWWADEAYYLLTISLLRQGEVDSAGEVYGRMTELFPESPYIERLKLLLPAYESGREQIAQPDSLPPDFMADFYVRRGWELMDAKKFREALESFARAVEVAENSDVAALFAGECAYYLKDYAAADSFYSMVHDSALVNYALWGQGWSLVRRGKFAEGRNIWRQIADSSFSDPVAFAVAKSFYLQRQLDSAVAYLGAYLSDENNTRFRDEATYLLALAQLEGGDTSSATATAEKYLRYFPIGRRGGFLANRIGEALFESRNYSGVVAWADSFADKLPDAYGDSLVLLAERAKYHAGQYSEPLQILDGFIAARPHSPLAPQLAFDTGTQFEAAHRWRDAIYSYTKAKKLSLPGDSVWNEAAMGILRSALAMGDTARAREELHSILIDGEMPYPALGEIVFARYMVKNGDAQSAIEIYNDVLNMQDTFGVRDSAILDLAGIYADAQMFAESEKILYSRWERTKKPSSLADRYATMLIYDYWHMGEQDSAVSFAVNFADSAAQPCSVLVFAGQLTFEESRSGLAAKVFDKMKELSCEDMPAEFVLRMAELMAQQDRPADACSLFNLVLAHHPDDSLGEIAREGIKSLPISCDTGGADGE